MLTPTIDRQNFAVRVNNAGPNVATRIWRRWRPGHKYRAGVNQVVPGVADERSQPGFGAEPLGRPEEHRATSSRKEKRSPPSIAAKRGGKTDDDREQSEELLQTAASVVDGVLSASSSQVALWATTRGVILAMLAAACRSDGNGRGSPETQSVKAASARVTCADARSAIFTLLARVFGTDTAGSHQDGRGQETTVIGEEEASTALDWWFEGFRSITTPPRGGVDEGSSLPLLEDAPRLLLEGMLGVPKVEAAFVRRGLTCRLADTLRVSFEEMRNREAYAYRCPRVCSRDGDASSCDLNKLPTHDPSDSRALPGATRGDKTDTLTAENCQRIQWWLIFDQGWGGASGGGGEQCPAFEDALGRARGTVDECSCRTALGEIFEPEAGKEDDDPTTDGNNSLGSAAATPVSIATTTAKQRQYAEGEGGVGRRAEGGTADAINRGRVAPPMLRLDALDSALDTEGWASARLSSSAAVAALSAASTRTASEHLVRIFCSHPPSLACSVLLSFFALLL